MNTSDRELLELAAKAAGLTIVGSITSILNDDDGWLETTDNGPDRLWNPLTNDGDALRLAVRLYLDINQFPATDGYVGMIEIWRNGDGDPAHVEYVKAGDDRLIATRRAIVRAAAEIGRNMK